METRNAQNFSQNHELLRTPSHRIVLDRKWDSYFPDESDFHRVIKLATAIEASCDSPGDVMIVGGVALRLLEASIGANKEGGVMSSQDVDVIFLSKDERRRVALESELNQKVEQHVGVSRLFDISEKVQITFPQILISETGGLEITALRGAVTEDMSREHLETVELIVGGKSLLVASPALLYHLYATRSLGRGKRKDWLKNKFHRVRKVKTELENRYQIKLLSPLELQEWRTLRARVRHHPIAKLLNIGVDVHDWLGRPIEKAGLATKIR